MLIRELINEESIFDYLDKSDIPRILYHGTTTAHGLGVGEKLVPPSNTQNITEPGRKKNLDIIFLTPDKKYAKIYAGRSVRIWGGDPVIYEVIPLGAELFKSERGVNIYTAEGGFIIDEHFK